MRVTKKKQIALIESVLDGSTMLEAAIEEHLGDDALLSINEAFLVIGFHIVGLHWRTVNGVAVGRIMEEMQLDFFVQLLNQQPTSGAQIGSFAFYEDCKIYILGCREVTFLATPQIDRFELLVTDQSASKAWFVGESEVTL